MYYKKAFEAKIFHDKIYKSIEDDSMRNKILKGKIIWEDCNSDKVFDFLKLLYNPMFADRQFEAITKDEWVKAVKA